MKHNEDECPDCGAYTGGGSWCDKCLEDYDYDVEDYEECKRQRIAEDNEDWVVTEYDL